MRAESGSATEAMLIDVSVDAIFGWAPALGEANSNISGGTIDRSVAVGNAPGLRCPSSGNREMLRYSPHALRSGLRRRGTENSRRLPDRAQGLAARCLRSSRKRDRAAGSREVRPGTTRRPSRWSGDCEDNAKHKRVARQQCAGHFTGGSCADADNRFPSWRCCRRRR